MDRLLQDIRKYWGRRAPSFSDNINQEDPDRWMDVIEQEIPVSENCRVLDIGTGPGFFAVALAKRGYDVTAVDLTPEMLEQAKKNAGPLAEKIHFLPMDAEHLDFPDNSFDVLVTRNLTWNLEHPDQAYAEWFRVMRPGGTLLNFDAIGTATSIKMTIMRQNILRRPIFGCMMILRQWKILQENSVSVRSTGLSLIWPFSTKSAFPG